MSKLLATKVRGLFTFVRNYHRSLCIFAIQKPQISCSFQFFGLCMLSVTQSVPETSRAAVLSLNSSSFFCFPSSILLLSSDLRSCCSDRRLRWENSSSKLCVKKSRCWMKNRFSEQIEKQERHFLWVSFNENIYVFRIFYNIKRQITCWDISVNTSETNGWVILFTSWEKGELIRCKRGGQTGSFCCCDCESSEFFFFSNC